MELPKSGLEVYLLKNVEEMLAAANAIIELNKQLELAEGVDRTKIAAQIRKIRRTEEAAVNGRIFGIRGYATPWNFTKTSNGSIKGAFKLFSNTCRLYLPEERYSREQEKVMFPASLFIDNQIKHGLWPNVTPS